MDVSVAKKREMASTSASILDSEENSKGFRPWLDETDDEIFGEHTFHKMPWRHQSSGS